MRDVGNKGVPGPRPIGMAPQLRWIVIVVSVVVAAACGHPSVTPPGERDRAPSAERAAPGVPEAPPPVTVTTSEGSIALEPWTYCYGNGCADGMPPEHPPHVGDDREVVVEYPLPGWSFQASFSPAGERCGRVQTVPLEETQDGAFVLRPAGYAGDYEVTLTGRGDGDLFVTFRWTTPVDGPLPEPRARAAILADNDGNVDSYGVEIHVSNLARTPRRAHATVTVESRDGNALTFEATRARTRCLPEGTVYWDGPDSEGLEAAKLGDGPFRYTVALTLDGARHVATATWPDDEIRANEPSVALDFSPELPALGP